MHDNGLELPTDYKLFSRTSHLFIVITHKCAKVIWVQTHDK